MLVKGKQNEKEWVESVLIGLMEETVLQGLDPEKCLSDYSERIVEYFEGI